MSKIDLKAYSFSKGKSDYRSGDILRKVRVDQENKDSHQNKGLVTYGFVEATQVSGGYGWAISDFIKFGYMYTSRPVFTWGQDGTMQVPDGYTWGNDNIWSQDLPATVHSVYDDCIAAGDFSIYQPAMFMPRVIHWYISSGFFLGCYLLVVQLNPECTETDKTIRIHYRFEGKGVPYSDILNDLVPDTEESE